MGYDGVSGRKLTIALYSAAVFLFWMAQCIYLPTLPTYIQSKVCVPGARPAGSPMARQVTLAPTLGTILHQRNPQTSMEP